MSAPAAAAAPSTYVSTQVDALTLEEFKKALPDRVKKSVTPEICTAVNALLADPDMCEIYRENLISYTRVMADGKFKLHNYVDAVKYVSHKLRGATHIDAYTRTFPAKIARFHAQGVSPKDIASYVTAYNKSKLVNLIMEQTLVPMWVLNRDLYQEALNTQAELMRTANSEKVRTDAANSILTHLKQPETQKVELDIGIRQDSSITALRDATMALVAQQRLALQSGAMSAQEAAHSKLLIEGEATEISE